jgi:hypothetical protein
VLVKEPDRHRFFDRETTGESWISEPKRRGVVPVGRLRGGIDLDGTGRTEPPPTAVGVL